MKIFLFILIIICTVIVLFSVTIPGSDDFRLWYELNVEAELRESIYAEIDKKLPADGVLGLLVNGAYELLAKDSVESAVAKVSDDVWYDIEVNNKLFYTEYIITMPDGTVYIVWGYLNKFKIINS